MRPSAVFRRDVLDEHPDGLTEPVVTARDGQRPVTEPPPRADWLRISCWERIAGLLLVLGLSGVLADFFVETRAYALVAMVIGFGGHLIAQMRLRDAEQKV